MSLQNIITNIFKSRKRWP